MNHISAGALSRAAAVVCGVLLMAGSCWAQQTYSEKAGETPAAEAKTDGAGDEARVREELESMRALISQQASLIEELRKRVERLEGGGVKQEAADAQTPAPRGVQAAAPQPLGGDAQRPGQVEKAGRVQELDPETGEVVSRKREAVSFSGDVRMQYDQILNQLNASPNAADPSVLGNELTARNRLRVRARLAVRGSFGEDVFAGFFDASGAPEFRPEFDWGLRLATGTMTNVASSNQALTDFFTHKPFALDQAYIAWNPRWAPGLRLQGGKFEAPWLRTEMTLSNLVHPEGLSQTYTRGFKDSKLSELTLVAWQLPFLELNQSQRYPVTLLFNFVTNTQARDVVVAGPGGVNQFLTNNENNGYWAEAQLRRLRPRAEGEDLNTPKRGDLLFNYTFTRIEKDAVLTPFNYDDLIPQSDVRAHRLRFSYVADPRVTVRLTALFNGRPNGLLGVFGTTPPGSLGGTTTRISLGGTTTRIQLDTTYRF